MALLGPSALVMKVLNSAPVMLTGTTQHVSAVADKISADINPFKYHITQYWEVVTTTSGRPRFTATSLVILSTVPIEQPVCYVPSTQS